MRRLGIFAVFSMIGCATAHSKSAPVAPGASVADFDRGSASGTIGETDPEGGTIGRTTFPTAEPYAVAPIEPPPPAPRALLAGPPQAGRLISDPETIRVLERALARRGYYQGPIDGQVAPALTDGLRRFQADNALPATGSLDAETARRLDVPYPAPPPPRQAG